MLCFVPEFLGQNRNDLLAIKIFLDQFKMFCFRSDNNRTKSKRFAFVPLASISERLCFRFGIVDITRPGVRPSARSWRTVALHSGTSSLKVTTGGMLEGGGWAGSRQAAAGADQESGPVPGAGGQSHCTQILFVKSSEWWTIRGRRMGGLKAGCCRS